MFYCLVLKISVYPAERRGNNNYKPHHVYNNIDFTDVEDVKFVINFDYPSNSEDYVHRIGRTGRSQRTGTAYTFFTPANANKAADLVSVLKEAKQVINPKLQEMADSRNWNSNSGSGRGRNRWGRGRGNQSQSHRSLSRSRSRSPRRSRRERTRSRDRSRRKKSRSISRERSPPRINKTSAPPPQPPPQSIMTYQNIPPPTPFGSYGITNGTMFFNAPPPPPPTQGVTGMYFPYAPPPPADRKSVV